MFSNYRIGVCIKSIRVYSTRFIAFSDKSYNCKVLFAATFFNNGNCKDLNNDKFRPQIENPFVKFRGVFLNCYFSPLPPPTPLYREKRTQEGHFNLFASPIQRDKKRKFQLKRVASYHKNKRIPLFGLLGDLRPCQGKQKNRLL